LSRNVFERRSSFANVQQPPRGVRQDNPAPNPAPLTSPQPAPPKQTLRTAPKKEDTTSADRKKPRVGKDVQLNLWVRPVVKAELERVAQRESLSISSAGEALLEKALQTDIHTQHSTLLDTIIHKAIAKHMRSYSTRIAVLLVRVAFASEQTRSIVTNILSRQPAVTQDILAHILNGSSNVAKSNITRKTPQLETIINEVEQWFTQAQM
jgi:hypothetical protein